MKILVNAIPLMNIHTGISRYIQCLYHELEKMYGGDLEIGYFDGENVLPAIPAGPPNIAHWSKLADIFWKLPAYPALLIRILVHHKRERRFFKFAQDYELYHEPAFFPFKTPNEVKTVFTIHDLSIFRYPQYHPKERVLFFRLFFKRRLQLVDHFLSVSEFTKKEIIDFLHIKPELITNSHLAHDQLIFKPRTNQTTKYIHKKFNLPEKYFLFVGSGDPRKNKAVISAALLKSKLDIPLVTVGWSGWSEKKNQTENTIYLGYISDNDLAQLYSNALIFILPSIYEGFGLPLLEAMACGCPVIASRKTSLPEIISDAGIFLNNPCNHIELADLLVSISGDDNRLTRLREAGIKQAKKFSWKKTARTTYQVFKDVLEI